MKNIIFVVLMVFSINVAQAQLSVDGLSSAQVAKIKVDIAKMQLEYKQAAEKPIESTLDKMMDMNITEENLDKFSKYGEKMAKVITGFATEIGISVNQFLNTGWGVVAMILLTWHFYGSDLSLIIFSMGLNFIFLPIWIAFARSGLYVFAEVYTETGKVYLKDGTTPVLKKQLDTSRLSESVGRILAWSLVLFVFIQIIILLNIG